MSISSRKDAASASYNKIRAYALQDKGADTIEANERLGLDVDLRRYEQCAEILLDLGLNSVRLMSKIGLPSAKKITGLKKFPQFASYLETNLY